MPKVVYGGRLGCKSANLPLVLEGPGAESALQRATWMETYQYSLGFGRFRYQQLCTVGDVDDEISIFLRFSKV